MAGPKLRRNSAGRTVRFARCGAIAHLLVRSFTAIVHLRWRSSHTNKYSPLVKPGRLMSGPEGGSFLRIFLELEDLRYFLPVRPFWAPPSSLSDSCEVRLGLGAGPVEGDWPPASPLLGPCSYRGFRGVVEVMEGRPEVLGLDDGPADERPFEPTSPVSRVTNSISPARHGSVCLMATHGSSLERPGTRTRVLQGAASWPTARIRLRSSLAARIRVLPLRSSSTSAWATRSWSARPGTSSMMPSSAHWSTASRFWACP